MLNKKILNLLNFNYQCKVLYVTVGNILRNDDAVGPHIYSLIKKLPEKSKIINVEDKPERAIDFAIEYKPQKIFFIDAADFSGEIGEIKIFNDDNLSSIALSTHTIPLPVISSIIKEELKTEIYFVGIQANNLKPGMNMHKKVKRSAELIAGVINEL